MHYALFYVFTAALAALMAWRAQPGEADGGACAIENPLLGQMPPGVARLRPEDDVVFRPEVHLALEDPVELFNLTALGYSEREAADALSPLGFTKAFRLLSPEGVRALERVLRNLEPFTHGSERIERMIRGTVFRSSFIRDLCLDASVTAFVSRHFGVDLVPHTVPHQLGHGNFAPRQLGRTVDKWHVDNVDLDWVLFVTDLGQVKGGAFEVFLGTKTEADEISRRGERLPRDRVVSIKPPEPGFAIMQQGHRVVHRAAPMEELADRMTLVNSYVPKDTGTFAEATKPAILRAVDPEGVVAAEWTVHRAMRASHQLAALLGALEYGRETEWYLGAMRNVRDDLSLAIDWLAATESGEEHFGDE